MTVSKRRSSIPPPGQATPPAVRRRPKGRAAGAAVPRIQIAPMGEMHDFWGQQLPRPIAPGRIRAALSQHFSQWPNLLSQSLGQLWDRPVEPAGLAEIKVRLFQEGDFQFIFRVTVRRRAGGQTQLAMVVAKDGAGISKMARRELDHLHHLHQRDAQFIARPLQGGMVSVDPQAPPGRAKVFVYFTQWLTGLHELGVDRRLNFYINELPFHTFRPAVSDTIRAKILAILFGFWDPARQKAMEPPQIASGDFVISRPQGGKPLRLCLIACRKMLSAVSLAGCLRLYLGYHGEWAGQIFHFLPKETHLLVDALNQGLVERNGGIVTWEDVARELRIYVAELEQTAKEEQAWTPLPALRRLIKQMPR